jgi:hypothetical protein
MSSGTGTIPTMRKRRPSPERGSPLRSTDERRERRDVGRMDGPVREGTEVLDEMLHFRLMISPWLIRVLFVLGCLASLVVGGVAIGYGISNHSPAAALVGVLTIILGPILVRLICESSILFFRINETLNDMYALMYATFMEERDEESDSQS